jgi:hypothetical protein
VHPYAEHPVRAALQLLADLLVLLWVFVVVEVARAARDLVNTLQGPGRTLTDAGGSIRGTFDDAARTASGVPFVGDDLARALGGGTAAGDSLADAGRQTVTTVGTAATGTAWGIVLLGVVPVVLVWLLLRVRWILAARSARTARAADADLLALRAVSRQPVRRLLAVAPHPAAAWRRDDRAVIARLAALELRSLGLRPPGGPSGR